MPDFSEKYSQFTSNLISMTENGNYSVAYIIDENILNLLGLLCDDAIKEPVFIPNYALGELALCVDKSIGYTKSETTKLIIEKTIPAENANVLTSNLNLAEHSTKYQTILLFPSFDKKITKTDKELYIEDCLNLLADQGKMVALLPKSFLVSSDFTQLRKKILDEFSLEAVFSVKKVSRALTTECSIVVIEKKKQNKPVYMTYNKEPARISYYNFSQRAGGFNVELSKILEEVDYRFDVEFYDPDYDEAKSHILTRETVKLGSIADVFTGASISAPKRKDKGDYLIIKPQHISDGVVHYGNNRKEYYENPNIKTDLNLAQSILKQGDILIGLTGKNRWAIYNGKEDYAIANSNVAIIRGKDKCEQWLKLFFSTNCGKEKIKSQVEFLSHCGVYKHITTSGLLDMIVPNQTILEIAEEISKSKDIKDRAVTLLRSFGWDVKEDYKIGRFTFDIALFDSGNLDSVVETQKYTKEQINNNEITKKFSAEKKQIGSAKLYLLIEAELFEYNNGKFNQQVDYPKPINKNLQYSSEDNQYLQELMMQQKALNEIGIKVNNLEIKVDDNTKKINEIFVILQDLRKEISSFQADVEKKLEKAVSQEEVEKLMHDFQENCVNNIQINFSRENFTSEYKIEKDKLISSFKDAWNKLDESSKSFLISSKLLFNYLSGNDLIDYSGVCLLVTKALEVELKKRFFTSYLEFLKKKYYGMDNLNIFPPALLDNYQKTKKLDDFSLGSVQFIMCSKKYRINIVDYKKNKEKLLEYSREIIFSNKKDNEILDLLQNYAKQVDKITREYRNRAAHTDEIKYLDAKACFDLILDVEKLLIKMLNSFNE